MAEHYGEGFGQGIGHKTVTAQLSNTQLSETFSEKCVLSAGSGKLCIKRKATVAPAPKADPISEGEEEAAVPPSPGYWPLEASDSPFPSRA